MTRLEKLSLFLRFWFSPWGAAKGARWEGFTGDLPFSEEIAEQLCRDILSGSDEIEPKLDWSALEGFDS